MWRTLIPRTSFGRPCGYLAILLATAVSGVFWAPGCRAQQLFTHSYLVQEEDPSCMLVLWQTDTGACDGHVDWGYYGQSLDNTAQAVQFHQNIKNDSCSTCAAQDIIIWQAEICGAAPGLRIAYHVYASYPNIIGQCEGWENWSSDFYLPLDPEAKHVTFYGYGDTRDCGPDFQRVSKAIKEDINNDTDARETVLLHSGDAVYNGGQSFFSYSDNEWLNYFNKYTDAWWLLASVPVSMAMGNHDFAWQGKGNYPKYFYMNFPYEQYDKSIGMVPYIDDDGTLQAPGNAMNDAYFSFDYGPLHVAVLNPYTDGELGDLGGCYYGSGLESGKAQSNWLQQDLALSNKPWKILMLHVPPISCDCSLSAAEASSRSNLESIAAANGASLAVTGHAHYYQHLYDDDNNIHHLVLGGGGASLDSDCGAASCGSYQCNDSDFVCNPCSGGYDPDSFHCIGCFFHYARFHVEHDGHITGWVYKVNSDGSTADADLVSINRDVPYSTSASFKASSTALDYRTPLRFYCTTAGNHFDDIWDFGDGTTSLDENPFHSYPKPTESDGCHTYHVTLTNYAGVDPNPTQLTAAQDILVYNGGAIQVFPQIDNAYVQCAYFITPPGQTFDQDRDFQGFNDTSGWIFNGLIPGDYIVTFRALGYDDWQEIVHANPGEGTGVRPNPAAQSHSGATIAIGSVPTGAEVTINPGSSGQLQGTTPFFAPLCSQSGSTCPDDRFTYVVKNGPVTVERVGDVSAMIVAVSPPMCGLCGTALPYAEYYEDVRPQSGTAGSSLLLLRQPSDQRIVRNGSALLRVEARSKSAITYRWFEGESGDTSTPLRRATSAVYATPQLKDAHKYWVRVYSGIEHQDSRTATISLAGDGPKLTFKKGKKICPETWARMKGNGFNPDDPGENRVFFDELQAHVREAHKKRVEVAVPKGLAGRAAAIVRAKVNGVWSEPREVTITGYCR